MRVLFVSPHSDDICVSLGGTVAAMDAEMHLLTVFTRSLWAEDCWSGPTSEDAISAARREEDRAFCSRFGVRYCGLDLPDSSIRHSLEGNLRRASGDEAALQQALERDIAELVEGNPFDLVFAPLGLGGHQDHAVCGRAVRRLGGAVARSSAFYEDLPYAAELGLRSIAAEARRLDRTLQPVLIRSQATVGDKLGSFALYASQQVDALPAGVIAHNDRLTECLGDGRRGVDASIVERVWTPEPAAVRALLGESVELAPGSRSGLLGRALAAVTGRSDETSGS